MHLGNGPRVGPPRHRAPDQAARLDLFQRVILGLSQAGVRQPDKIGALTGLHTRLCAYIMDGARRQGLLGKDNDVTDRGIRALRTSVVTEDTEWSVRYVFTDPFSGNLWPRAADRLDHAYVREVTKTHVTAELGTAGVPARVTALRLPTAGPDREDRPALPRPEQVIEAVRRDQVAREATRQQELERRYNLGPGPGDTDPAGGLARTAAEERLPELTRVSFIGEPAPVEILAVIEAAPGCGRPGLDRARSVRGRHQRHVQRPRYDLGGPLPPAGRAGRTGWSGNQKIVADQYRHGHRRARERVEDSLVREYGPGAPFPTGPCSSFIDARLAELEQSSGKAMHATFALFEELMFRACVAYPMSAEDTADFRREQAEESPAERARQAQARRSQSVVAERIRRSAEAIGVYELPRPLPSQGAPTSSPSP